MIGRLHIELDASKSLDTPLYDAVGKLQSKRQMWPHLVQQSLCLDQVSPGHKKLIQSQFVVGKSLYKHFDQISPYPFYPYLLIRRWIL